LIVFVLFQRGSINKRAKRKREKKTNIVGPIQHHQKLPERTLKNNNHDPTFLEEKYKHLIKKHQSYILEGFKGGTQRVSELGSHQMDFLFLLGVLQNATEKGRSTNSRQEVF
jgi:hypothetical protein